MKYLKEVFRTRTLHFVLFMVFASFSYSSFGQELLIKESVQTFNELSFAESEQFTKIQAQGMYTNYYLVEFESLAETQENGKISINLPDDNCGNLIYKARSVDYKSEQNYIWYGVLESTAEVEDCFCRLGSITLISSEFGKIGHIIIDDKTYELLQLGESKFILGKLDGSKFTESECGVNHETPIPSSGDNHHTQPRSNGHCNVRCLVLFTNNALIAEGGVAAINNRVNLAIAQTNQALRNSDVKVNQLRIDLAGVEALNFIESNNIRDDINDFANNLDAQNLRNALEADIVVLLTDGEYGGIFGIVQAIGPDINSAYSIVQIGAATTGRFTFAHEVAHLFGGGHENDPRNGIPHGHSFKTGNFLPCIFGSRQRTILHRAGADDVRIQHYSNPDVKYDGKKTGKENTRDNARQLRNEACVVAQFRETIEPFFVSIGGDLFMCPCQGAFLEANIFGGTAGVTYVYEWFTSIDGINWNPSPYNGPNSVVNVPCTEGDGVFVRVDVVGSDGNTGSSIAFVEATTEWTGQEGPCMMFLTGDDVGSNISIAPNPSHGQSEVIFHVYEIGRYSIYARDINGKIVKTLIKNKKLEKGEHRIPFNIEQDGVFFIQSLDSKGNQSTAKFLKL